jgi:hypothetical protein
MSALLTKASNATDAIESPRSFIDGAGLKHGKNPDSSGVLIPREFVDVGAGRIRLR